jgi:hypothetical protein
VEHTGDYQVVIECEISHDRIKKPVYATMQFWGLFVAVGSG